jgi:hypothetical protein
MRHIYITAMGKGSSPFRKPKNEHETGSLVVKLKKSHNRIPIGVVVAWTICNNRTPCTEWNDVHLLGGWILSHRRMQMPPVPWAWPGEATGGRPFCHRISLPTPLTTSTR